MSSDEVAEQIAQTAALECMTLVLPTKQHAAVSGIAPKFGDGELHIGRQIWLVD